MKSNFLLSQQRKYSHSPHISGKKARISTKSTNNYYDVTPNKNKLKFSIIQFDKKERSSIGANKIRRQKQNLLGIINNQRNSHRISRVPNIPVGRGSNKILNINQVRPNRKTSNFNKEHYKSRKSAIFTGGNAFHSRNSKVSESIGINNNPNIDFDFYNNNEQLRIMKMNQHIQNEIDSKELKKKLKNMKKSMIQKTLILLENDLKNIIEEESPSQIEKTENIVDNNNKSKSKIETEIADESQSILKSKSKLTEEGEENEENEENKKKENVNVRGLKRIKNLYDSLDDEEFEDEADFDYYLSPSSYYIKVYDFIMFFCCLIYLIYVPYLFATNKIFSLEYSQTKLILFIVDIIYIIDLIVNFFRAYQNFDENLVRKTKYIFLHYLKSWFLLDFIESIPYYTLFQNLDKLCIKDNNRICTLHIYDYHNVNPFLYMIMFTKIIKIYKMVNENSTLSSLGEILERSEFLDNNGSFINSILAFSGCLNVEVMADLPTCNFFVNRFS